MSAPHEPYFQAVLAALGDLAHNGWAEHCNDNGDVMLTEIHIELEEPDDPDDYQWFLTWDQVSGWQYGLLQGHNVVAGPDQLLYGSVPTPASVATAARTLVADGSNNLPAVGEETPVTDRPLTPGLAEALADKNLPPSMAAQLAYYAA